MDSKYIYVDGNSYIVRNTEFLQKTKKFNFAKYASKEEAFVDAKKWRDEQEKRLQEIVASQLTIYKETKAAKEKAEQRVWELEKEKREKEEREIAEKQAKQYFDDLSKTKQELTPIQKWKLANIERSQTEPAIQGIADLLIVNSMLPYDKRTLDQDIIEKQVQRYEEQFATKNERLFWTREQWHQSLFSSTKIIAVNKQK